MSRRRYYNQTLADQGLDTPENIGKHSKEKPVKRNGKPPRHPPVSNRGSSTKR
jgi:hypothetical protein